MKINFSKHSAKHFSNNFPNKFSISFYKFDNYVNKKFLKLPKHDKIHPIKSDDVYVIDDYTGEPVLYEISNHEVKNDILLLVILKTLF